MFKKLKLVLSSGGKLRVGGHGGYLGPLKDVHLNHHWLCD